MNVGPDGSPTLTNGLCGSFVVDGRVGLGLFLVAEGRACWGRVKNAALQFCYSKIEHSIKDHRVWKIVWKTVYIGGPIVNCEHAGFLSATPPPSFGPHVARLA
jgi:hypothetical protein